MGILTSAAEIDELRRLVADGWSDRQLADRFGCCVMTIYNRRREHGIDRAKRVPQDVDSEELRRLVDSGMTDAEIADRLGVSISAEKYYVLKYGCTRDVKHHITRDEMESLVDDGLSDDEIAKRYGFTKSTVATYRQRYGILRKEQNLSTKTTDRELKAMLQDGDDDATIADAIGTSVRAVSEARRRLGVMRSTRIDIPADDLRTCLDAGMGYDEIGAKYGCSARTAYVRALEYGITQDDGYSISERHWKGKLLALGLHEGIDFIHNDRHQLHGMEIDFLFPAHEIGIEINPSITHASDEIDYVCFPPKATTYHQQKALLAEREGINLIGVYDWADEDKILDVIEANIGMTRHIGARKCDIVTPTPSEERAFLTRNHLQGYVKSDIRLGLAYEGKLVAIMTFGGKRFGAPEDAQCELLRYASLHGVTVVGGASKLFTHIVRDNGIDSVLSYASLDISNGRLYERLGFEQVRITKPSYMWTDPRNPERHYSWNVIKNRGVDNILGTHIGKGNNIEIMRGLGFVRVYNSGSKVYLWKRQPVDGRMVNNVKESPNRY